MLPIQTLLLIRNILNIYFLWFNSITGCRITHSKRSPTRNPSRPLANMFWQKPSPPSALLNLRNLSVFPMHVNPIPKARGFEILRTCQLSAISCQTGLPGGSDGSHISQKWLWPKLNVSENYILSTYQCCQMVSTKAYSRYIFDWNKSTECFLKT